jgi:hypothetical protein
MSKHTYQIAFRGDIIRTFTSVYPEVALVVGYEKPMSSISVHSWFKTEAYAVKQVKERVGCSPLSFGALHSAFVTTVKPGLTEISACPVSYSSQRLSGRAPEAVSA